MITHVIADPALQLSEQELARELEFSRTRESAPQHVTGNLLFRGWVWIYRAALRARSRRELRDLPDELLKDIGMSRVDVQREASRPFWR